MFFGVFLNLPVSSLQNLDIRHIKMSRRAAYFLFMFFLNTGRDLHFSYAVPKSCRVTWAMKTLSCAWFFVSSGLSFHIWAEMLSILSSLAPSFQPFTVRLQVCGTTKIKGVVMKYLKGSRGICFSFISLTPVQNLLKLFSIQKTCCCLFFLCLRRIQQHYKCVTFFRPKSVEQLLMGKKMFLKTRKLSSEINWASKSDWNLQVNIQKVSKDLWSLTESL